MLISTGSNIRAKARDGKDQATVELPASESCQILEDTRCHLQLQVRLATNSPPPKAREKVTTHSLRPTTPEIQLLIPMTPRQISEQPAKTPEEAMTNLEP